MLSSNLPITRIHIRILETVMLSPYEWPSDIRFPRIRHSKLKIFAYKINLFVHGAYFLLMLGNYLVTLDKVPVSEQTLALLFLGGYLVGFLFRFNAILKPDGIVEVITSFLQFEEGNKPDEFSAKDRSELIKLVQILAIVSCFATTALVGAMLLAKPCLAPYMGYILLGREGPCQAHTLGLLGRSAIFTFDLYMWFSSFTSGIFDMFCVCFVVMPTLGRGLHQVGKLLGNGMARNKDLDKASEGFRLYRQLQILGVVFNDVYQRVQIPTLMLADWIFLVISLYTCVKLHDHIEMPGFAFFPLVLVDSLCPVVMLKVASGVLVESRNALRLAKSNPRFGVKSYEKKMARSMKRVAVKFGSNNYVDELTPFTFVNQVIGDCVNLMLLS